MSVTRNKGFDIVQRSQWKARKPRQVTTRNASTVKDLYIHWPGDAGVLRQSEQLRVPEEAANDCLLDPNLVARAGRIDTVEEEKAYCRSVQNFHMDVRGWNDIAYNYLIFKSGRIYAGRTFKVVPASQAPFNTNGVSICCVLGTADLAIPHTMKENLRDFVAWAETYARHELKVKGHRDVNQTTCPGPTLYAYVDNLDAV